MKIAYNITYVVDAKHVDTWRIWMTKQYLPKLMETGCFLSYKLHKLIGLPSTDDPTYSVQLVADDKSQLQLYQSKYEGEHINLLNNRFKNKLVEFRTTMVVVDEGYK